MNKLYVLTLVSAFLLVSCHKDTHGISSSQYYPNNVGDSWVYDVTDSSQSTINNPFPPIHYSVKVSVTGFKKLLDGIDAAIWQYQYPSGNDTNYVRITGDTVKIFENSYSKSLADLNYPGMIFLLPFHINAGWTGKVNYGDSSRVIGQSDIVVASSQTFTNCFEIYHSSSGFNFELTDYYWFKPDLGMITRSTKTYDLAPTVYRKWQLRTYYVH